MDWWCVHLRPLHNFAFTFKWHTISLKIADKSLYINHSSKPKNFLFYNIHTLLYLRNWKPIIFNIYINPWKLQSFKYCWHLLYFMIFFSLFKTAKLKENIMYICCQKEVEWIIDLHHFSLFFFLFIKDCCFAQ